MNKTISKNGNWSDLGFKLPKAKKKLWELYHFNKLTKNTEINKIIVIYIFSLMLYENMILIQLFLRIGYNGGEEADI